MANRVDVARAAGVSPAVVSYVLNDSHPVADKTRERVTAAIEELGYRPNGVARSLALSRSHTIGLLVPDSSNPYFAELSSAIEDAAFAAGYTVLLGNGADSEVRERTYVSAFVDRRVDGVIICPGSHPPAQTQQLLAARIAVVGTDRTSDGDSYPAVVVDNLTGAHEATKHLLSHGRRTVACITGPSHISSASARAHGWRAALTEHGIEPDPGLYVQADFAMEAGRDAARDVLLRHPSVDGIFVASDVQAVGALRALADAGLRVGVDVAVVGFDGIALGDYVTPRLSTIEQPLAAIADAAVARLSRLIEGDPQQLRVRDSIVIPTRLRRRESCGCQPITDDKAHR